MTTDNSNTDHITTSTSGSVGNAPELAVEFHYTDGDVGVYADHLPEGPEYALWTQFEHFDEDRKGTHIVGRTGRSAGNVAYSHILVRADNAEGQTLSNRLCATEKALRACELLVEAYKTGEANGGSVDWSDVDLAWEVAREALAIAQDTPTDDPEGTIEPAESCPHEWVYTGTAYGGDDPSYHGEGRCICRLCGMDGDA